MFNISSKSFMGLLVVSGPILGMGWVHDRFLDQYWFMIGSRTSVGSRLVPGPVWVRYPFHGRYGFVIGSWAGMGS